MKTILRILITVLLIVFAVPSFAAESSTSSDSMTAVKMAEKAKQMAEEAEKTANEALAREALKLAEDAKKLAEKTMKKAEPSAAKSKARKVEQKKKKKPKPTRSAGTGPGISLNLGKTVMTFRGNFRMRFNSRDNLALNMPGGREDSSTFFDQRFRLNIEGRRGPVRAVVLLDKGDIPRRWVQESEGTSEMLGDFSTTNSFLIRWAYLQYVGDVGIKLGRQPVNIGNNIVLQGDMDAIDISFNPLRKLTLGLIYLKPAGGYGNYSYTVDEYYTKDVLRSDIFYSKNDLNSGILQFEWMAARTVRLGGYAISVFDNGKSDDADLNLDKDFNASTTPRDGNFDPTWVGLVLKGRKDKLSYKGEAIYLTGSYTNDRDLNAYAAMLDTDYRIGKYTVGAGFGRGSGNKIDNTGDFKDFAGLFLCKYRNKFGNLYSEDIKAGYFLFNSNLANITYYKVKGARSLWKNKMDIELAYILLRATEAVPEGRGPVNGFYSPRDSTLTAADSTASDTTRNIGQEIDLSWNYDLGRRFNVFANFAYFMPGDAYKQTDGTDADPATEFQLGTEFKF